MSKLFLLNFVQNHIPTEAISKIIISLNSNLLIFLFQYWILNITDNSNQVPSLQKEFFTGFISVVSEIDCARVYSVSGQEMIRKLPDFLVNVYVSGSVSPGAELRLATEEFMKGSHRADEYIRRYLTMSNGNFQLSVA